MRTGSRFSGALVATLAALAVTGGIAAAGTLAGYAATHQGRAPAVAAAVLVMLVLAPAVSLERLVAITMLSCALPLPVQALGGLPLQAFLVFGTATYGLLQHRGRFDGRLIACGAGLLLAVFAASIQDPAGHLHGAILWLAFCVWLYLVGTSPEQISPLFLLKALCATGCASAALSVAGKLFGLTILGRDLGASASVTVLGDMSTRFAGALGDYELYGELLSVTIVGITWLLTHHCRGSSLLVWAGAVILCIEQVIETGTRSSIALTAAASLFVVLAGRYSGTRKVFFVGLGVLAVPVALPLVFVLVSASALVTRLESMNIDQGLGVLLNRSSVWIPFTHDFSPFSEWIGRGPSYPYAAIGYYPHNLAMFLGFTLGLSGLVAFAALISLLVIRLVKGVRQERPLAGIVLLLVFVLLVNEVKVEFFRVDAYAIWVAGLLGLAARIGIDAPGLRSSGEIPTQ